MPKRSRKKAKSKPKAARERPKKREPDTNETAYKALQAVVESTEGGIGKDPLAVILGRRGGLKGGRARADNLSEEERRESARKAAQARWHKS